jgi:hypothetical protein
MAVSFRVALVVMSLVAAVNCGGSSPSSPSTPSLTGTWVGTTTDSLVGAGNMRVTISQSGSSLTGTWASTFPNTGNNS